MNLAAWFIIIPRLSYKKMRALLGTCCDLYKLVTQTEKWKKWRYKTPNHMIIMDLKKVEFNKKLNKYEVKTVINHTIQTKDRRWFDYMIFEKDIDLKHLFAKYKYPYIPKKPIYPYGINSTNYKYYISLLKEVCRKLPNIENALKDYIKFIGIQYDDLELYDDGELIIYRRYEELLLKELHRWKPVNILRQIISLDKYSEDFKCKAENILGLACKKESIRLTREYIAESLKLKSDL